MMRHILYATDLSVFNSYLLKNAYQLATTDRATKISIVHAVEPMGVFADAVIDAYLPADMLPHIKNQGMPALMNAIGDQVMESLKLELSDGKMDMSRIQDVIIERGEPAQVILDAANRLEVDMVVMGSTGHQSSNLPILGSVVAKVLQLSSVPVLMIPTAQTPASRRAARKLAS